MKKILNINKEIKILAILYRNENNKIHFLALRNNAANQSHGGDFWYVITGQVETNENLTEAVKREIFEETGIKDIINIMPMNKSWEFTYIRDRKNINCKEFGYLVEIDEDEVKLNEENIEYVWLELEDFIRKIQWQDKSELREICSELLK